MPINSLEHDPPLPAQPRDGRSLWKSGLMAGLMAGVANATVFAVAVAAGIFPSFTFQADSGAQMSVEPVLLVSFVGVLAGVGTFALLRRSVAKPVSIYLWVAAAVLLLSFAAPVAIPGTALLQAIALNVMHVVVAGLVIWAVLRTRVAHGMR